uniref:DAGKc domain-containing protein n=1 Tax=Arundo donax TaxID=35708 RepID=A0A0A9GQ40_ARUDO
MGARKGLVKKANVRAGHDEWLPDCLLPSLPPWPLASPPTDSFKIETLDQPNPVPRRSESTQAGEKRLFPQILGSQHRMEGETDTVVGSCSKPCGPLEEYCIPDYILKPDAEQVLVDHAPLCPVVVFINSRSGG